MFSNRVLQRQQSQPQPAGKAVSKRQQQRQQYEHLRQIFDGAGDETRSLSTVRTLETLTESLVSSVVSARRHPAGPQQADEEAIDSPYFRRDPASCCSGPFIDASSSTTSSCFHSGSLRPSISRSSPNRRHATRKRTNSRQTNALSLVEGEDLLLQGRDSQVKAWKSILSHQKEHRTNRQFLLVRGESGSGKSRLVQELTSQRGLPLSVWTIGGKFDSCTSSSSSSKARKQHNLPYSAFASIFEDLYYSLLYQQEDEDELVLEGDKEESSISSSSAEDEDDCSSTAANPCQKDEDPDKAPTSHHQPHHQDERKSLMYAEICSRLQEVLNDEESLLLIKFVPALRDMLLVQSLDFKSDLEAQEDSRLKTHDTQYYIKTRYQFQRAFQKVVATISKCFASTMRKRLVLVLDDLQWADQASLELLKAILLSTTDAAPLSSCCSSSQDGLSHSARTKYDASANFEAGLIVVGCIRKEDLRQDHPVQSLLQELQASKSLGVDVHQVELGNLSPDQVQAMIVDMARNIASLQDDDSSTVFLKQFSDQVHQRTSGNPFFVTQYMQALWERHGTSDCKWDELLTSWMDSELETTLAETTESGVMEILLNKYKKLPKEVKRMLPYIGSLGFSFPRELFVQVVQHFTPGAGGGYYTGVDASCSPEAIAKACLKAGLLEENGPDWYRWTHDTLQDAAAKHLTTSKSELTKLQFELAEFWFDSLGGSAEDLESQSQQQQPCLFSIANLFIKGRVAEQVQRKNLYWTRRIQFASLYLQAANKATESASFDAAETYANIGIRLVPEMDRWSKHYDISLELYSTAAQAELCTGNLQAMQLHCNEVIAQKKRPLLDKQRVYNTLLDSKDSTEKARQLCMELLELLEVKFPKDASLTSLVKTKRSLPFMKKKDVSQNEAMKDPSKLWAMKLMEKLQEWHSEAGSAKTISPVLKSLQWTKKYGVCESSTSTYATVGLMLSSKMGDFAAGEDYANRAVGMLDRVLPPSSSKDDALLAKTYKVAYGQVLHWTTSYGLCRSKLLEGYEIGLQVGDVDNALDCYLHATWLALSLGSSLDLIQADLEAFVLQAQKFKNLKMKQSALIALEAIRCLTNSGEHSDSDLLHDNTRIDEMEVKRWKLQPLLNFFQLYVDFYMGRHKTVVDFVEKHGEDYFETMMPGVVLVASSACMSTLSCLTVARETKDSKMATSFTKKVKTWVDKGGNPNVVQYRALLDAEWAAFKGNRGEAVHTYGVAVLMAERRGLAQDVAIAHERASDFYKRLAGKDKGREHARMARNTYKGWGAMAVWKRL